MINLISFLVYVGCFGLGEKMSRFIFCFVFLLIFLFVILRNLFFFLFLFYLFIFLFHLHYSIFHHNLQGRTNNFVVFEQTQQTTQAFGENFASLSSQDCYDDKKRKILLGSLRASRKSEVKKTSPLFWQFFSSVTQK